MGTSSSKTRGCSTGEQASGQGRRAAEEGSRGLLEASGKSVKMPGVTSPELLRPLTLVSDKSKQCFFFSSWRTTAVASSGESPERLEEMCAGEGRAGVSQGGKQDAEWTKETEGSRKIGWIWGPGEQRAGKPGGYDHIVPEA